MHQLEVLLTPEQLHTRATELAQAIRADIGDAPVVLLGVLKGAFPFLTDLSRALEGDVLIDFVQISSYGDDRSSSGVVRLIKDHDVNIQGQHVVIVEDIVDSGLSLRFLRELLSVRQPLSLKTAAMLQKDVPRDLDTHADYIGFVIPDVYVVGYGLDDAERYRNLPYVAVLSGHSPAAG